MTIEQIIVLAIVQGVTEFLPISSSGHLILVPKLLHWQDQGLVVDVMVHVGTLFAILIYFWRDVARIVRGAFELLKGKVTDNGRLAIYIVLASIPAVAFGIFLKTLGYTDLERNVAVVAWNTILYGILMLVADMVGSQNRTLSNMTLGSAMIIGVAQALALIPGTSRSGVTITAGRFLGFSRPDCARFSFLLGIPAIAGAGVFTVGDALASGEPVTMDAVYCAVLTFFAGLAAIAFLMALVKRVSLLPFVLYRMVLGGFLLVMLYT
ncbi:MAG TPA: undecaprenyl-diphosphate phosphatase [Methyloceanibacter sp.]|nr:undecaprenyl-diphosphate phosphatase [Methyloceanibacter sp.]